MDYHHSKIVFYSDIATYEFRAELENQIKQLDRRNVDYVIFRTNGMVPKMSWNGSTISGMSRIKDQLNTILQSSNDQLVG